jgi:VIT1/CCC1 family predicted Fe2+/Mn2+ transporter
VLRAVAEAEKEHAAFWRRKTGVDAKPARFRVALTVLKARVLGLTFTLKSMENTEGSASKHYKTLAAAFPDAVEFSAVEAEHEAELLGMLDEEMLRYVGSIVLGLNDALVELTGSLAGFTLALGSAKMISLAGLVTGVSAAFSMAASDYLSSRADGDERAGKSALYTGVAYIITVALLVAPFLLLSSKFIALGCTLAIAVVIILLFNYYLATAKTLNFRRRFAEMCSISLGVAVISFLIGWALKSVLGVEA